MATVSFINNTAAIYGDKIASVPKKLLRIQKSDINKKALNQSQSLLRMLAAENSTNNDTAIEGV